MPKYNVLLPLDHDNTPYVLGDTVDIADAKQAQALIDLAVIEPVTKGKNAKEAE